MTIFLLSGSQEKWVVSGSFSTSAQHPGPFGRLDVAEKGDPGGGRRVKPAALLCLPRE